MNNSSEPLVSIVCTTYNQEKYIEYALKGFVTQETNFPFEVIVHDDASTDSTADIIHEYEKKFPHIIKPIYQTENQYSKKVQITKDILMPNAKGKYIAVCEGDDFWVDKHKLLRQVTYMENHMDCSCTYHPVHFVVNGKIVRNDKRWNTELNVSVHDVIRNGGDFIATPSIVYRKEFGLQFPKFRQMPGVGDYRLQILLALNGQVHYFPEIMACYRFIAEGSWNQKMRTNLDFAKKHWFNEIKWLMQLNEETNYKYKNDISHIIFLEMRNLKNLGVLHESPLMYKVFYDTEKQLATSQEMIIGKITDQLSEK